MYSHNRPDQGQKEASFFASIIQAVLTLRRRSGTSAQGAWPKLIVQYSPNISFLLFRYNSSCQNTFDGPSFLRGKMYIIMQAQPNGATMICTRFHEKRGPMGKLTISSIGCESSSNHFPPGTIAFQNIASLQDSTIL